MTVEQDGREVAVIGAPLDLGAGRRGVDMGPSAIRYAGLDKQLEDKLGVRVSDAGNVISPVVETTEMGDTNARYLRQILDLCDRLSALVAEAAGRGALPLVLGGDHSVALGSLVGMAKLRGAGGVVWI
ncbi:MAG: arginase, partial [Actinobacteria bacterium]